MHMLHDAGLGDLVCCFGFISRLDSLATVPSRKSTMRLTVRLFLLPRVARDYIVYVWCM